MATNNDNTPVRATRSSIRNQKLIDDREIDLAETSSKENRSIGTRMATRGRKVSLSPVLMSPLPEAQNPRSHSKAALAISKSIRSLASHSLPKKHTVIADYKTAPAPPKKKAKRTTVGRWEQWEQIEFLKGLRAHGRGHWKVIAEGIPTRTTVQVKTHAQVELKKLDSGIDIFQELDEFLREEGNKGTDNTGIGLAENDENLEVVFADVDDNIVEASTTMFKKKAPKKKNPEKKKLPKQKTPGAKIDPTFLLSPASAPMQNDKTPVVSNKSAFVGGPPLSFTTSSSVTMATSTFRHYLPHQRVADSIGFHPMMTAMTGTLPSSFFQFPLPPLPTTAPACGMSTAGHPKGCMTETTGRFFGVYEAANALLGLATANRAIGGPEIGPGSSCE